MFTNDVYNKPLAIRIPIWPEGNKIWLNNAMMVIMTYKGEKVFRKQV